MALQQSEILAIVRQNDTDHDGKISKAEFKKIAKDIVKDMGVNEASLVRIDEAYFGIAGSGASVAVDDVLAYFGAFAQTAHTYDEAAFTTILDSLGGVSRGNDGDGIAAAVDPRGPMGANADWNEAESAPIVTRLERNPALGQAVLGAGRAITLARILDHYRDSGTRLDGQPASGEFAVIAARIGAENANPPRFAAMSGSGGVIALAALPGLLDTPGMAGSGLASWANA